jgi:hypothetical protein
VGCSFKGRPVGTQNARKILSRFGSSLYWFILVYSVPCVRA